MFIHFGFLFLLCLIVCLIVCLVSYIFIIIFFFLSFFVSFSSSTWRDYLLLFFVPSSSVRSHGVGAASEILVLVTPVRIWVWPLFWESKGHNSFLADFNTHKLYINNRHSRCVVVVIMVSVKIIIVVPFIYLFIYSFIFSFFLCFLVCSFI